MLLMIDNKQSNRFHSSHCFVLLCDVFFSSFFFCFKFGRVYQYIKMKTTSRASEWTPDSTWLIIRHYCKSRQGIYTATKVDIKQISQLTSIGRLISDRRISCSLSNDLANSVSSSLVMIVRRNGLERNSNRSIDRMFW